MNDFENAISYSFKNKGLLRQAFIHSSHAYENKMAYNNERLEFLGDAVLELVISDYIYNKYKNLSEGDLTKLRAAIVCEPALAKMARVLNISNYLKLGRGESSTGGGNRDSILSDALEAVIGAVYLDGGFESAKRFILSMMLSEIEIKYNNFKTSDYKTYLQEIIQRKSKLPIEYVIISESGPDHDKEFIAQVTHEKKVLGEGSGKSKKEAEQSAALNAVESQQRIKN